MAISLIAILSLFISQIRLLGGVHNYNCKNPLKNIDVTALKGSKLKTIKVTFCQKAEEYYRDINDYKGDWPGIKFSSSLQCKFPCNLNVHALFLLSYCPLSFQYAYISSKSGILKIAVFE